MNLFEVMELSEHGVDVYVGRGPHYPWGGLYGGQIVAQALRAAGETVADGFVVHSLRAYFIRRGDHDEPVGYEVDRIRNGHSFCTRRVVARQAVGAILNLEASFHRPEDSFSAQMVPAPPSAPGPDGLESDSWSPVFQRRSIPKTADVGDSREGSGRALAWMRVPGEIDDPIMHACGLAYLSDDLPTDSVVRSHPLGLEPDETRWAHMFSASLDHAIWFHRPFAANEWMLYDFSTLHFSAARGLARGYVFTAAGEHVATVVQEVLLREHRPA